MAFRKRTHAAVALPHLSSGDSVATSSRETLPPPAKQELAAASACCVQLTIGPKQKNDMRRSPCPQQTLAR